MEGKVTRTILLSSKMNRVIGSCLIVILLLSGGFYIIFSQDNSDSGINQVGEYTLFLSGGVTRVYGVNTEYISDGDEIEFSYILNGSEVPDDSLVYAVGFGWNWEETDETTNPDSQFQEASCIVNPGENAQDKTTGKMTHDEFHDESEGYESPTNLGQVFWDEWDLLHENSDDYNLVDSGNNTVSFNFTNITMNEINEYMKITGDWKGHYSMSISVEAEVGGNNECPHSDEGEEINYGSLVRYLVFEIVPTN